MSSTNSAATIANTVMRASIVRFSFELRRRERRAIRWLDGGPFVPVREAIIPRDRSPAKVRFDGKNEDQFEPRAARRRWTRTAGEPLHVSWSAALRDAIRDGRLEAGSVLPSSRALASQLGVSRGIVVEAYEQLVAEGYLASRPGGATAGRGDGRRARRPARRRPTSRGPTSSTSGPAGRTSREFPRAGLAALPAARPRARRRAERLTYLGGHGVPELRDGPRDVPQPGPRDGRGPGRRS